MVDSVRLDDKQRKRAMDKANKLYKKVDKLDKKGLENEAIQMLIDAAGKDCHTFRAIGRRYARGTSEEKKKALEWFVKAVEHDELNSRRALADCYEEGCYEKGVGFTRDLSRATFWYIKCAEREKDPATEFLVGGRFQEGKGCKQDFVEAIKWYERSLNNPEQTQQRKKIVKEQIDECKRQLHTQEQKKVQERANNEKALNKEKERLAFKQEMDEIWKYQQEQKNLGEQQEREAREKVREYQMRKEDGSLLNAVIELFYEAFEREVDKLIKQAGPKLSDRVKNLANALRSAKGVVTISKEAFGLTKNMDESTYYKRLDLIDRMNKAFRETIRVNGDHEKMQLCAYYAVLITGGYKAQLMELAGYRFGSEAQAKDCAYELMELYKKSQDQK